jgi:hypothetical protein
MLAQATILEAAGMCFEASRPMSAVGQKQTSRSEVAMSALPPKADIVQPGADVRLGPFPDKVHRSKEHRYSITSSARSSMDVGSAMPSALAVLRLIMNSNLVGCSTGRSVGFAPLRILSIKAAAR